jgi:hypothetical protein
MQKRVAVQMVHEHVLAAFTFQVDRLGTEPDGNCIERCSQLIFGRCPQRLVLCDSERIAEVLRAIAEASPQQLAALTPYCRTAS